MWSRQQRRRFFAQLAMRPLDYEWDGHLDEMGEARGSILMESVVNVSR